MPALTARAGTWSAAALACVVCGAFLVGLRPDAASLIAEPSFLIQAALLLTAACLAATISLTLSVPGSSRRRTQVAGAVAALCWTASLAAAFVPETPFQSGMGIGCVRNVLVLSILPGAILFQNLRRARPLQTEATGWVGAFGAASLACLATRFICRNDSAAHLLVWHYLPVTAISLLGIALGRILFTSKPR